MPNQTRFRPPMQPMAQNLASRGRYGDSMLVHMNPAEVKGLASLSPTGSLTRNPDTGQPEAFLPLALSLLGSGLGGAGLLGGNALLLGALGSGLGTWAETGELGEGIKSGMMSALMGKISGEFLKGMGGSTSDAVKDGLTTGANTRVPTEGGAFISPTGRLPVQETSPGIFSQLGEGLGFNPEGTASGIMGGLDTTLGQAMDPTKGIIATGLIPGLTGAGMSWEPDPIGKMMEDDDDWGEGVLRDRGFRAAPEGYRPGVDPEWDYYRNPFEVDTRPRGFQSGGITGFSSAPRRSDYGPEERMDYRDDLREWRASQNQPAVVPPPPVMPPPPPVIERQTLPPNVTPRPGIGLPQPMQTPITQPLTGVMQPPPPQIRQELIAPPQMVSRRPTSPPVYERPPLPPQPLPQMEPPRPGTGLPQPPQDRGPRPNRSDYGDEEGRLFQQEMDEWSGSQNRPYVMNKDVADPRVYQDSTPSQDGTAGPMRPHPMYPNDPNPPTFGGKTGRNTGVTTPTPDVHRAWPSYDPYQGRTPGFGLPSHGMFAPTTPFGVRGIGNVMGRGRYGAPPPMFYPMQQQMGYGSPFGMQAASPMGGKSGASPMQSPYGGGFGYSSPPRYDAYSAPSPSFGGKAGRNTGARSPSPWGSGNIRSGFQGGGQFSNAFEGLVPGSGGGMDDTVPASIEGREPILVSRDEYVIPADTVSDLGDGSTGRGAEVLDGLVTRTRLAKNGSANQPGRMADIGSVPMGMLS